MSAIFKTRKVPRHLVIEPEVPLLRKKRRWHLSRLLLILTLLLVGTSTILAMLIGVYLGMVSGWRRGSRFDRTTSGTTLTLSVGEERVTGLCTGIAPDGALVLETPAGRRTIYSGIVVRD